MNRFRRTDCGKVPVTLVCENNIFGVGSLNPGGNGGSPAMCRFLHIAVKIIVCKNRTAYGCNPDGISLHAKLIDYLCNKAMYYTVGTAGAIMKRSVRQRFWSLK
jgi:hypothetical protein